MKKNRKRASARVLSVLMTLAMIVGLMPTAAFADEETNLTEKLDTVVNEQTDCVAESHENDGQQQDEIEKNNEIQITTPEDKNDTEEADAGIDNSEDIVTDVAADDILTPESKAETVEAEEEIKEEQPADEETYAHTYTSEEYQDKGISSVTYKVETSDTAGKALTDGSGKISLVESAGEWAKAAGSSSEEWTVTERCAEWSKIIGLLQDSNVNVDSRKTYVLDMELSDADGGSIDLNADKTSVSMEVSWGGYLNYEVYIYDGTKVYKETIGTHDNEDYSQYGMNGYHVGNDTFVVPDGCKAVYVSTFNEVAPLEPGTYTLDADLTVLGKNNQVLPNTSVYLSNPNVPPTKPMKNNAYLVVGQDGSLTLSLDGFNKVFSQQNIESGRDVHVKQIRYDENFKKDLMDGYGDDYNDIPYDTRIDGITVTLDNYNGYYSFSNCKQYPLPLLQDMFMQLDLTVDFSSAEKSYARPEDGNEYVKTFTDENTGIDVKIRTTEDFGAKMIEDGSKLDIKYLSEGDDEYDDAKFKMDRLYIGNDYKLLKCNLFDKDGNELTVSGNSQIEISGVDVGKWRNPVVNQLHNDNSPIITSGSLNNTVYFTVKDLDVISITGKYSKGGEDMDYNLYPEEYGQTVPFGWESSQSEDGSYSLTKYMIACNGQHPMYSGVSEQHCNNKVRSIMKKETDEHGDKYFAKLDAYITFKNNTRVEVKLPYDSSKPYYYFVMTDGNNTYVKQINKSTIHNGSVYFDIINSIGKDETSGFTYDEEAYSKDWTMKMLQALDDGYDGVTPSSDRPTAYILNSDVLYAGEPIVFSNKIRSIEYDGKSHKQNKFVYNDTVNITGDSAVDAGEYTFSAVPAEGRTWLDGTSAPKSYNWNINKVELSVRSVTQVIYKGEKPDLSVNVTGFVNAETAETAADYISPEVKAPDTLEEGQTYTLMPEGGSAKNYDFYILEEEDQGKLTVISADTKIAKIPAANSNLLATGEDVTGVNEGEGYTLSDDWKASEGGKKYTATAKLNEGYIWSDGTTEDKEISWILYKPVEKPVIEKTKILYTEKIIKLIPDGSPYTYKNGYSISGKTTALYTGNYTANFKPARNCLWSDGTSDTVSIEWSVVKSIDIPAAITGLVENKSEQVGVPEGEGYTVTGNKAVKSGSYTAVATLNEGYIWSDGTSEPKNISWSIAEAASGGNTGGNTGGSTTTTEKTEKAIANLYVPGELNKQLPGVTAYLTNPDNPVGTTASNIPDGWKFKSAAPTSPMNVNNAVLKTDKSGKKTLTVQVCNPVFTLQSIEGMSSNGGAKVIDTKTEKGDFGGKKSRITEVTFEILKDANSYVFENCVEYPTLLSTEWNVPLTLVINDIDKLPSADGSKVDTGSTGGSGSSVTPTAPATPGAQTATGKFKDVADSAYYKKAVDWAVEKNVTSGATADTFAPDKICTRAQTVTFLWRAAGSPEPTLIKNPFTDVSADAYYYKAVLWAVEKGITKGMTETTFAPDKTVTRGQVVTFQWRLAGSPSVEGAGGFNDVASDSYCGDAVKWAAKNGITAGKSASAFAPDEGCTRAQIVTFLYRQLGEASGK